ncbi:MAG: hypothetical protein HZY76_21645 [Anaerolineae bacterium]|nr:MAG: hypothetical protein HZY76_21645 [Anaerolineae bacterium]
MELPSSHHDLSPATRSSRPRAASAVMLLLFSLLALGTMGCSLTSFIRLIPPATPPAPSLAFLTVTAYPTFTPTVPAPTDTPVLPTPRSRRRRQIPRLTFRQCGVYDRRLGQPNASWPADRGACGRGQHPPGPRHRLPDGQYDPSRRDLSDRGAQSGLFVVVDLLRRRPAGLVTSRLVRVVGDATDVQVIQVAPPPPPHPHRGRPPPPPPSRRRQPKR